MSPPRDALSYYRARRSHLIRLGLCVNNPKHGPARLMRTTCAKCGEAIRLRNARRNPLRKIKGES
jgi:hypothetical protein